MAQIMQDSSKFTYYYKLFILDGFFVEHGDNSNDEKLKSAIVNIIYQRCI